MNRSILLAGAAVVALAVTSAVAIDVQAAAGASPSPAGAYVAVAPTTVLDTTAGVGGAKARIASHGLAYAQVSGIAGVPVTASVVALNIAVVNPDASGFAVVYPYTTARPATFSIDFTAHQTIANRVITQISSDAVSIYNGSAGAVDFVVNVVGYYLPGAPVSAGSFASVPSATVLDTGTGVGAPASPVAAHATVTVQVAGRGGVPTTNVGAVALNLAVVAPVATGFGVVYAAGTARPGAANIDFTAKQTIADLVITRISPAGAVTIYNGSAGSVRLVANVVGYYLAGAPSVGGTYVAIAPSNLLDTGTGVGVPAAPVPAHGSVTVQITGRGGVPSSGVATIALTVAVVSPTNSGFATVFPSDVGRPPVFSLEFPAHQTIANAVVTPLSATGAITLYNGSSGSVRFVANASGYTLATPPAPVTGIVAQPGFGTVTLSWTNPTSASYTGVLIRRAVGSTPPVSPSDGTYIADVASPTSSVADSGVTANTTYSYALFAHDATGDFGPAAVLTTAPNPEVVWSAPTHPDPVRGTPTTLSCPTVTFCMAGDVHGFVTRYDGTNWTPISQVGSVIDNLSCASSTFCVAAGGGYVTSYNGSTWSTPLALDPGAKLRLSCPVATFCAAVDQWAREMTFNGSSWSAPTALSGTTTLYDVSCVSATFCVAGGVQNVYVYRGVNWAAMPIATGVSAQVVSCRSSTFCMTLAQNGVSNDPVTGAYVFDGSAWTKAPGVDLTSATAMSCGAISRCLAVAPNGTLAYTSSGWSQVVPANGTPLFSRVSCPAAAPCVAIDGGGNVQIFNGTAWSSGGKPDPTMGTLNSLTCASATFCVAVDRDSGYLLRYDGTSWSAPQNVGVFLSFVSCPTSTFCMGLVGNGQWTTYDGTHWAAVQNSASMPYTHLTCPTVDFCAATDRMGNVLTYRQGIWSTVPPNQTPQRIASVSCTSATFCMAIDIFTNYLVYNGSAWSSPTPIPVDSTADCQTGCYIHAACASSTYCLVNDGIDPPAAFDGANWSKTGAGPEGAVSCPAAGFCVGLGSPDTAQTLIGSAWSPSVAPDPGVPMTAISCPTTSFCMAIGGTDAVAGS